MQKNIIIKFEMTFLLISVIFTPPANCSYDDKNYLKNKELEFFLKIYGLNKRSTI